MNIQCSNGTAVPGSIADRANACVGSTATRHMAEAQSQGRMAPHDKKSSEQWSPLLISGAGSLAGTPAPAAACAPLQRSHGDLAET